MTTLRFEMTEQILLAKMLGEEKAKQEQWLERNEQNNLPHSVDGCKAKLKDIQGIVHKIFAVLEEQSPYAAKSFVADFDHHYNWELAYRMGEGIYA